MILDEAPMRALSRRFGLAARLARNTVQRGVDLAMGGRRRARRLTGRAGGTDHDALAERLQAEYGLRVTFEASRFEFARWIAAKSPAERDIFIHAHPASLARDLDGAPKIDHAAGDFQIDLIQMPGSVGLGSTFAQIRRDHGPEMVHPAPNSLLGDHDAPFRQQVFFDVT
jgi:hypothetical protein